MNNDTADLDQDGQEILTDTVSDEALEAAAGSGELGYTLPCSRCTGTDCQ
jgi:hypothetical protein